MTDQAPNRPSAAVIEALERQLEVAQRITHIGSWEWSAVTNVVAWSTELYRIYGIEPGTPITFETFLLRVHPDDRARVQKQIGEAMQRGGRFSHNERIVLPDGTIYLDGNSLGALPVATAARLARSVEEEWGTDLITSWTKHGWIDQPAKLGARIARLVGAESDDDTLERELDALLRLAGDARGADARTVTTMIVQVRTSPPSGERHSSHKPAKAKGLRSFMWM